MASFLLTLRDEETGDESHARLDEEGLKLTLFFLESGADRDWTGEYGESEDAVNQAQQVWNLIDKAYKEVKP